MKQGDIFLADLNPVKGHEQAGYRPVLIIQNDILNKNLNTAVIIPITSNLKAKNSLITWFLPKNQYKLKQDSVALLLQIRTIDKKRLQKKVSSLKRPEVDKLLKQLKFIF